MLNVNLMLMLMSIIVLMWPGPLPVASHRMSRMYRRRTVCSKFRLPMNAVWEDNKRFKCPLGYELNVQTTCKNGLWYLEPSCKDCYKYTQDTYAQVELEDAFPNKTQAECDVLCAKNDRCSSFVVNLSKDCLFFAPPVFFASFSSTLAKCVDECTKLDECLSLTFGGDRCYIFNVTLSIVNTTNPIRSSSTDTVVEKICQARG